MVSLLVFLVFFVASVFNFVLIILQLFEFVKVFVGYIKYLELAYF